MNKPSENQIEKCIFYHSSRSLTVPLIVVCLYIMLVIERPWESISYLNGWPIERVFATFMILVTILYGKFKIVNASTNKWVYSLLFLHFILSPFAYNYGYAIDQSIEYTKMVILYLLMLAVVDDEFTLKVQLKAYLLSMILYSIHSLWEYSNGRFMYRMGISRMMGVGELFNDPNAFAGSLVISLPIAYVLARDESRIWLRRTFYGYGALVGICVVLTGSRAASIALLFLVILWLVVLICNKRYIYWILVILAIPVIWNVMPEEKQIRLQTIWDSEAGPANAHESIDGRKQGWVASLKMFKQRPFTGVGAGGKNFIDYRINSGIDESPMQAHILYGEIIAEFGVVGALMFFGLILSIISCCMQTVRSAKGGVFDNSFIVQLSLAIIFCILLLLILGLGGHNFYRPMWLWLAAWSSIVYKISNGSF